MSSHPQLAAVPSEPLRYRFGTFELDARTGELRREGVKLRLQEQPFLILKRLLANPSGVVTREDLHATLWPADTFVDFDTSLEEAAMDLGASPLRTFLSVTLPLIFPAIAAAWMLAFALSLDDLVIASFTTGPGATTLPIRIYSEVRLGVKPEMNAVCSIMVAVVGVAVIVASLLAKVTGGRGAPSQ